MRALEPRITQFGVGTTFAAISRRDLDNFVIPLAPLREQKRIVAKVDELMTLCDKLQAQLKEAQEASAKLTAAAVSKLIAANPHFSQAH